jgi:EmrB/QacA subfamily drug resistance transporter
MGTTDETTIEPVSSSRAPASPPGGAETGFTWSTSHTVALVVLCFAQLLDTVDITIVNVALPTLRTDLGFSATSLEWVVNAYIVLFGGFLLLGGRAGDILGRRRVFLAGIAVFGLASIAAGAAQDATTMVIARGAQGVAGAFIAAMTLSILATIFPEGPARNKAMGIWGTTAGISGALGVTLGGLFVAGPGWRWIFLMNIPICALILLAGIRYLEADRPAHHHRRFDLAGAISVTAGATLLAYAVAQTTTHSWGSGRTIALLAASAVLLGYFAIHETLVAKDPLFSFSLFKNRSVTGANAVQTLIATASWSMFYFLTLYEQNVLHYSALKTGVIYLPLAFTLLIASGLGPALVPLVGIRTVVATGAVIGAAGMVMFARLSPTGSYGSVIWASIVFATGFAIIFVPINIAAVSGVPPERTGVAAALLNVSRQVGGAIGFAIVVTVATSHTDTLLGRGQSSGEALTHGFRLGYLVCAAVLGAAVLAALALFREDGRGTKVNLVEVQTSGIDV